MNIDNDVAERALKRVAIGSKNWLFAGHDEAGRNHATLYTLIASAERNGSAERRGFDRQRYRTTVQGQFLPDVWKAEDTARPIDAINSVAQPTPL